MEPIIPHGGPGPEPSREIDLTTGEARTVQTFEVDTADLQQAQPQNPAPFAPPAPPVVQATSPPPPDPQQAVAEAEKDKTIEELKSALGQMRSDYERQMQEMRLQMELTSAQRVAPPAQPQQVPEYNAEDPVTMGQLSQMLDSLQPVVQAQALRATWDVTPQEEQAIFQRYPQLTQTPEPARTQFILKAVPQLRQAMAASASAPDPAPAAAPRTPSAPLTANVVPLTEHTQGPPVVTDPKPGAELQGLLQQYEAAKNNTSLSRAERARQMKSIWMKINEAQGITMEQLSKSSFAENG